MKNGSISKSDKKQMGGSHQGNTSESKNKSSSARARLGVREDGWVPVTRFCGDHANLSFAMKIYRETSSNPPFNPNNDSLFESSAAPGGMSRVTVPAIRPLATTWRKLPTGLRGARLYVAALPNGGACWLVEVMYNGAQLSRRFASELHARVWLVELLRPGLTPASFDREERSEPLGVNLRDSHGA
jgi:hypothetical protein